jgi:hypothetical protein
MSLKIEVNNSATAYHIIDGAVLFPYAVDARHAIGTHPAEWKATPWSAEDTAAARREAGAPEVELSPEDQAALDEHNRAVEEANERLAKFRAEQEEKRQIAEQVKADEALVASAPPQIDTTPRRPLTPAQIRKQQANRTDPDPVETNDQRIAREKAEADKQAAASAGGAPVTG